MFWWSSPSKFVTDLSIATKGIVKFCVFTEGGFSGCTIGTEDDDNKLAEGAILAAVCGWHNFLDGMAVAY